MTDQVPYIFDINDLKVSDPLYELSVYRIEQKKSLLSKLSSSERDFHLFLVELLHTFELNRLNFLKQSGISWLVFPSSTHTRYAHSVGTLTLGNYALDKIFVQTDSGRMGLRTYLRDYHILEEFLFALLVHDIGHFPFSHVLEQNEIMLKKGIGSHEELMRKYISGESSKISILINTKAREQNLATIFDVSRKYNQTSIELNLTKVIEFFGESEGKKESNLSKISILSELIDGVIDLDRLDHYNRDSYFMGLKLANVSIKGLLENVLIDVRDKPRICIEEDGEPYVLQLLFSKELLWQKALNIDVIRSYECMLNNAVKIAFEQGLEPDEVILMTDDELLSALRKFPEAESLLTRILARQPYYVATKHIVHDKSANALYSDFREWCKENDYNSNEFLLGIPPKFGQKGSKWLTMTVIDSNGIGENIQKRNKGLIDYFEGQDFDRQHTVRIFANNPELVDKHNQDNYNCIFY